MEVLADVVIYFVFSIMVDIILIRLHVTIDPHKRYDKLKKKNEDEKSN